jgi:uncharacterized membrane protein
MKRLIVNIIGVISYFGGAIILKDILSFKENLGFGLIIFGIFILAYNNFVQKTT